jgi:hypothetical protein
MRWCSFLQSRSGSPPACDSSHGFLVVILIFPAKSRQEHSQTSKAHRSRTCRSIDVCVRACVRVCVGIAQQACVPSTKGLETPCLSHVYKHKTCGFITNHNFISKERATVSASGDWHCSEVQQSRVLCFLLS